MEYAACSSDRFLRDIRHHVMSVIRDDGVHRHLRFRQPDDSCYHFDLITWPWHLCITGDCGTYVFSRVEDMFTFFNARRGDEVGMFINPAYWGEKLLSADKHGGYKEFATNLFTDRVKEHFDDYCQSREPDDEAKNELWEAIEDSVLSRAEDGEMWAYVAVNEFVHEGFSFTDFFDGGETESYTFHYLWNLYAIVWGIGVYDKEKGGLR